MTPPLLMLALIVFSLSCSTKPKSIVALPSPPGWPPHLYHHPNNSDIPCPYDNRTKATQENKESRDQIKGNRGNFGGVGSVKASFIYQRGHGLNDQQ